MIGQTISHYTILEKLGAGGMVEVFLAEDGKLDRLVALKFQADKKNSDSRILNRHSLSYLPVILCW